MEPVPLVVGPEEFAQSLLDQGVDVARVSWRPPLAVESLTRLLADEAAQERVAQANVVAVDRVTRARCRVVDVLRAGQALPVLGRGALLHAGPPLDWAAASGPMRGAMIGALLY